jgi:hypothetical protein
VNKAKISSVTSEPGAGGLAIDTRGAKPALAASSRREPAFIPIQTAPVQPKTGWENAICGSRLQNPGKWDRLYLTGAQHQQQAS